MSNFWALDEVHAFQALLSRMALMVDDVPTKDIQFPIENECWWTEGHSVEAGTSSIFGRRSTQNALGITVRLVLEKFTPLKFIDVHPFITRNVYILSIWICTNLQNFCSKKSLSVACLWHDALITMNVYISSKQNTSTTYTNFHLSFCT